MDDVLQAPTGRFELAHNYIRSHLEDPELTPETLASALNVSRRTLYACFAKYGHSPFALIQQLRLEECRRVLADATVLDRTITRIAFDQGFNDISHFSRVFKQTYGSSPRNYRKQVIG